MEIPNDIKSKYPRKSSIKYPDGSSETLEVPDAVFIDDHYDEREYWKGFELVVWPDGDKELRFMYWTRERSTKSWKWGQFSPIMSWNKLKQLIKMVEEKNWFK